RGALWSKAPWPSLPSGFVQNFKISRVEFMPTVRAVDVWFEVVDLAAFPIRHTVRVLHIVELDLPAVVNVGLDLPVHRHRLNDFESYFLTRRTALGASENGLEQVELLCH